MSQISQKEYSTLAEITKLYRKLDLVFPEKYKPGKTKKKCFSTHYYMDNELIDINYLRKVTKFRLHLHGNNPYSQYSEITETVLNNLSILLKEYIDRCIGHRAELVRYILIYENIEAILDLNRNDFTPYSMKQIMSRCLLYLELGYYTAYFHSGNLSSSFAKTFQKIYNEVKVLVFKLIIDFIGQSHTEKVTNVNNILSSYREYIFLFSTSSDLLSTEDEEHNLDINYLEVYLDNHHLGALSLAQNEGKNRYLNVLRLTKQIVQIMEKEFHIKFSYHGSKTDALKRVFETHNEIKELKETLCKSYDDFMDNCVSNCSTRKYINKTSKDFREFNINANNKKGIKNLGISDQFIAFFCRGFLISSSLGNIFDGSVKSGFIDEVLQKRSEKMKFSKMLNEFISPLIKILKQYIVISACMMELKIYNDFYIHYGESSREKINSFLQLLFKDIKVSLMIVKNSMLKIKNYLMQESSIYFKCKEIDAILTQLNLGASSYSSKIEAELYAIISQSEVIKGQDLLYFKKLFTSNKPNKSIEDTLSIFGMNIRSNYDNNLGNNVKVKIKKWLDDANVEIYKTMESFIQQTSIYTESKNNHVESDINYEISDDNYNIKIPNITVNSNIKNNI